MSNVDLTQLPPPSVVETLDFEAMRKHFGFLIDNGVHGLVTCGSLGEASIGDVAISGLVTSSHFLGSVIRTRMDVGGATLSFDMFNDPGKTPPAIGERITLKFASEDLMIVAD